MCNKRLEEKQNALEWCENVENGWIWNFIHKTFKYRRIRRLTVTASNVINFSRTNWPTAGHAYGIDRNTNNRMQNYKSKRTELNHYEIDFFFLS